MSSTKKSKKCTNSLIHETSPYLLQHAHNPVNWYAWNAETLQKAKTENKPLLISIGYSACHWCHVMEHETFEDENVANIMNAHFICVKVDREERPDIDQVYMEAVQLMTNQGGWPLNCFALPNGKPFYGGTYFKKNNWINILNQLHQLYSTQPEKVIEYANTLTDEIAKQPLFEKPDDSSSFSTLVLENLIEKWQFQFDLKEGGYQFAPKFPMPNNWEFLLAYSHLSNNKKIESHVHLTLYKMAQGGIFDQLEGGFARYATDIYWKVPHFEKMLYDNAQLISLYAKAHQKFGDKLFKQVAEKTINFCLNNLRNKDNGFFSALDADTDGDEGKYYTFTLEEFINATTPHHDLMAYWFSVNKNGFWENNKYILLRNITLPQIAAKFNLTENEASKLITFYENKLKTIRSKKTKPGIDDKTLTSWNALMVNALVDAYFAFQKPTYLSQAEKTMLFILQKVKQPNGGLYRNFKNNKASIPGFLDDYAFVIEALINLYQATQNASFLTQAKHFTNFTLDNFFDHQSQMFFYTAANAEKLVAKKIEFIDQVIPSSNSTMAKNLFLLGKYFNNKAYIKTAQNMILNMANHFKAHPPSYSNWAMAYLWQSFNFYEIAVTGNKTSEIINKLKKNYLPNGLIVAANGQSNLPLLTDKPITEKTLIYVCYNNTCQKPTELITDALQQIIKTT